MRPPLDFFLAGLDFSLFGHTMLQLFLIQNRAQLAHGILPVFRLIPCLGILDQDFFFLSGIRVFELIAQPHARLHLIHILSPGPARSECIPRNIRRIDIDFYRIVDQRCDEYRCKRSHALSLRIIRRYPHQPVHTVLAFQITVYIITFDLYRHRFDTGLVALQYIGDRGFIVMLFAPSQVHTHQHRCPVLRLGSSGSRIDFQNDTQFILFPTQHIAKFEILDKLRSAFVNLVHLFFRHDTFFHEIESQPQFFHRLFYFGITIYPEM